MKDSAMILGGQTARILVINPFGIGDVLFTTPVIKAIKESYPDSFIGFWCNERVADLIRTNPRINMIFPLSRGDIKKKSFWKGLIGSLKLYSALKKGKFNIALDYSLDHRYAGIAKLAGIKVRIGFNYKNRGRLLTHKLELSGYSDRHVVEYYLELLKFLKLEPKQPCLELFVSEDCRARVRSIFAESGILPQDTVIGIAPGGGASWGKDAGRKHWPAVNFAQLINEIVGIRNVKVLLLGDDSEKTIAETIKGHLHHQVVDLTGKLKLEDLTGVIQSLDLLIANDGGPLHMAVALGRKTLSFFGPVDYKVYGPYPFDASRHTVLKKQLECMPCYRNFRLSDCDRNRECLEGIRVEEAFEAAETLLKDKIKGL